MSIYLGMQLSLIYNNYSVSACNKIIMLAIKTKVSYRLRGAGHAGRVQG